jgi:hypothetical protein
MHTPKNPVNRVLIRCDAGCLRHVVGVTWFDHKGEKWDTDEPEMYFETLHEPYQGFWGRVWAAFQFVFYKVPMGADSSLMGVEQAGELIAACQQYLKAHAMWRDLMSRERGIRAKPSEPA